jgi:sec-independent protein translocase protein TatB
MFDISWTEFLLIGVVALIVIGPKELPGVLRTLGQWTRKVRSMANDFQNQFQEAMREAEMADLKKEVDDVAKDLGKFDPIKDVRDNVEAMSKDLEKSLDSPPKPEAKSEPRPETEPEAADTGPSGEPALTAPAATAPAALATTAEPAAAATEPASTEPASTERAG